MCWEQGKLRAGALLLLSPNDAPPSASLPPFCTSFVQPPPKHANTQRGYLPSLTYSSHYIRDPQLRHAVGMFLDRERDDMDYTLQVGPACGAWCWCWCLCWCLCWCWCRCRCWCLAQPCALRLANDKKSSR